MKVFAPHMVDCYKLGHAAMYTEGTDFLYSNLTPRSNKYFAAMAAEGYDGKMVVFGTQGSIMEIVEDWNDSFFSKPKADVIRRYRRRLNGLLGEGVVSTARMEALHDLGYLPLEIRTIDEGARIGMKVPMLTIKNTLPENSKGSPFPVYVANWEGGVLRVSIGKNGFTFRKPRVDQRELLLEAWNEWLDTHND